MSWEQAAEARREEDGGNKDIYRREGLPSQPSVLSPAVPVGTGLFPVLRVFITLHLCARLQALVPGK